MKFKHNMSQEDRDKLVRTSILRSARQLHNACKVAYKENKCSGCPFAVDHGCRLYEQPITWENKLKTL